MEIGRVGEGSYAARLQVPTNGTRDSWASRVEIVGSARTDKDLAKLAPLAFSAGWNICELYFAKLPKRVKLLDPAQLPTRLPELSSMPGWQRAKLIALRTAAETAQLGILATASTSLSFDALGEEDDAATLFKQRIYALHVANFDQLAAVNAQLLLAYRLGAALAMTVLTVRAPLKSPYANELKSARVGTILEWLDALRTVLPEHSVDAVRFTLIQWRDWAGKAKADAPNDPRSTSSLRKQGEGWRALLSGEKSAADMLEAEDYLRAATKMVRRLGRLLIASTISGLGIIALFVVGLLIAAGAWILSTGFSVTKLVAVALALGAPAGITASSIQAALKRSLSKAQTPIWEALLVEAIGEASYVNPLGRTPVHTPWWGRLWIRIWPVSRETQPDQDEDSIQVDDQTEPMSLVAPNN